MATSKQPRRKAQPRSSSRTGAERVLPDQKAMEAFFSTTDLDRRASANDRAQNLIYDAWERRTTSSRVAIAYKALAVSPLCADAYNLLASEAADPGDALSLYGQGLQAATLSLGPEGFEEFGGQFWGFLETRPYMRARHGLATTLVEAGREVEAMGHFRAMLELNPNDNQGMRYLLLASLLRQDDTAGARALLASYADEWSTQWLYTQALMTFREGHAARAETHDLVNEAISANEHVPSCLARKRGVNRSSSDYVIVGSPEEAADYDREFGTAWRSTTGAVDWLVGFGSKLPPSAPR